MLLHSTYAAVDDVANYVTDAGTYDDVDAVANNMADAVIPHAAVD